MTIMIGIDPHKASHTAVAINGDELVVDEFKLRASKTQATRLIEWAGGFSERSWAVESAGGLGYLLAQQLVAAGEMVVDVPPVLASRVMRMATMSTLLLLTHYGTHSRGTGVSTSCYSTLGGL